jgi:hypothetical protein
MPNRIINSVSRGSSIELTQALSSLLAIELLSPSNVVYLLSPWLSDVVLLRNAFGQFRSVVPEISEKDVRLSQLLNSLAERGTRVRITCRPYQPQTENFLSKLVSRIEIKKAETLHEKGLISARFYLRGSMNFTFSGVYLNDEHIEITTEPEQVTRALAEANLRWESY